MGRFYKTDSATPLDYMYSINTPLMESAVLANDQAITNNLGAADQLGQLAHYNYLQGDEQDAKAITNNYMKQINNVSEAIRQDPANWRKQLEPIRNIKKTLQEDYTTGTISKQIANYNKRKADFDAIDKQVELYHKSGGTKGVDPQRAALKKLYLDSQFDKTEYDPATGKYNIYKGGSIMDNIDVRKRLSDGFDKLKADGVIRVNEGVDGSQGEYFNKVTNKWEGLTQDKLLNLVTDRLKGDNQLWNYLREDSQIGNIKGVYDDKGQVINPYNNSLIKRSPEEDAKVQLIQSKIDKAKDPIVKKQLQDQLNNFTNQLDSRTKVNWNGDSYLAPILRGIVNQYAYNKSDIENDLSNNSAWNTRFTQANENSRQTKSLAQQYQIHKETQQNLKDRAAERLQFDRDKLDFEKYKFENPLAKPGTKSVTPGKATTKTTELPQESGIDKLATNSFENWETTDKNTNAKVPVLSIAGLSSDIDNFKNSLSTVNQQLENVNKKLENKPNPSDPVAVNNYRQLQLKQQDLQVKAKSLESDLNDRRTWYKASTSKAIENLQPEEREIYNKYTDKGIEQIKKEIEQAKKKYPPRMELSNLGMGVNKNIEVQSSEVLNLNKKLQQYISVKQKVDKNRDSFLENLRKDYIDEDAIKLGDKDNRNVADMILSSPQGLQLFDNQGNSTAGIEVDGKGISWFRPGKDNYHLSFADNSLPEYIKNSGTQIIVKSVAPTTKLGNGNAVLKVQFKDPNGEIPEGKDFYINSSPELQKQIATYFKGHKNSDIASIANNIDDDLANNIRNQLAKPNIQGQDQRFVLKVPDNQGNTLPLNVTKIDNHYNVTFEDKNGNQIPLPSLSGVPGFFNGSAELIKSFKAVKNGTLK